ncbi:MAG: SAM-dependent methyltransferase [Actinobacteria bacterium]|nr:SAM-dependent methyltransferase [Actinomycetota bacterium]
MKLDDVVPWGRSYEEYVEMFDLAPQDLDGKILDCAAGPASFNAEATQKGYRVVSCDPIYRFTAEEIADRIDDTYETVVAGAKDNRDRYVWEKIGSPEHMGEARMAAMRRFLEDFPPGLEKGRYRPDELPSLGFGDGEFDLALSSHFLFTYSERFSSDFHIAAIEEMCRVADEARVFPLLNYDGRPSRLLRPVVSELQARGYRAETRRVPYEFQKGGKRLLSVVREAR